MQNVSQPPFIRTCRRHVRPCRRSRAVTLTSSRYITRPRVHSSHCARRCCAPRLLPPSRPPASLCRAPASACPHADTIQSLGWQRGHEREPPLRRAACGMCRARADGPRRVVGCLCACLERVAGLVVEEEPPHLLLRPPGGSPAPARAPRRRARRPSRGRRPSWGRARRRP